MVDIQNAWLDETAELKESVERHIEVMNQAIRWFRRNKRPIIVIYHEDKEKGVIPGTKQFEFPRTVPIDDADVRLIKRYPNSFNKTELETVLRKEGIDTVLIVGLSASACALATVEQRAGFEPKFTATLKRDIERSSPRSRSGPEINSQPKEETAAQAT